MREQSTTNTLPHENKWTDDPNKSDKSGSSTGLLEKTSEKIHKVRSQATAAAHDMADKTKQRIAETSDAAKTKYVEVKEQAALKGAEAKQAVQSSFEKRPLAYVAGALLAGVAIGMALPRSRKESQALASSGQKLRKAASNAKHETIHAAEAAADTFQEEIGLSNSASQESSSGTPS